MAQSLVFKFMHVHVQGGGGGPDPMTGQLGQFAVMNFYARARNSQKMAKVLDLLKSNLR